MSFLNGESILQAGLHTKALNTISKQQLTDLSVIIRLSCYSQTRNGLYQRFLMLILQIMTCLLNQITLNDQLFYMKCFTAFTLSSLNNSYPIFKGSRT